MPQKSLARSLADGLSDRPSATVQAPDAVMLSIARTVLPRYLMTAALSSPEGAAVSPHGPRWINRLGRAVTGNRWVHGAVLLLVLMIAGVNLARVPHASMVPLLVGLIPFAVGTFVLCPLRWHQVTASGAPRRWLMRVYAEGELLGLITPAHAGADLWRAHQLRKRGMETAAAYADVAVDRIVAGMATVVFIVAAGTTLPLDDVLPALVAGPLIVVAALMVRRRHPNLLPTRPLPSPMRVLRGIGLGLVYQLSFLALLLGSVNALGQTVQPLPLLGVIGASRIAGVIPGMHGAGPREGALVAGLVALGLPLNMALGATALASVVVWAPALLLGGGCLIARRLRPQCTPEIATVPA
jgi:hypothetical protein